MNCLDCAIKDKKIAELREVVKKQTMEAIKFRLELEELSEHPESVISRYLQDGFVPFETKARYFSDFIRTKEWFYEL